MKSSAMRLLVVGAVAGIVSGAHAASPGISFNLIAHLDYGSHNPPPELETAAYYEVYDRNFEDDGGIMGWLELQAYIAPGGPKQVSLDTPTGSWVDHLSARLFRDGLELNTAEFDVRFTPKSQQGTKQTPARSQSVVSRDNPAKATFILSGPGGEPLEAGLYRLWIILDTRDLPPGPGLPRGLFVDDGGAYRRGMPDIATKGGLVFKVQWINGDRDLQVRYLLQRASVESGAARSLPLENAKAASHRKRAIEFAQKALAVSPENTSALVAIARNYVLMLDCKSAVPYLLKIQHIDPHALDPFFAGTGDRLMIGCIDEAGLLRPLKSPP